MFKQLTINLTNSKDELWALKFHIRETELAQKWAKLLQQDLPQGVRETERFVGFDSDPKAEIEKRIQKVLSLIENLKPLHPEIDFGKIDFTDVQKEVNRLHVNFADRHVVRKDLTKESSQYWNDLNVIIHQIEYYFTIFKRKLITGAGAYFSVTFYSKKKGSLTEEHYKTACLNRSFGDIYLNYSQVGRHILDLYWSQDEKLPLEHIQPFKLFSSDMFVYLGYSLGHQDHLRLMHKIEKWFQKKEKYFSQLGLYWDPAKLCIGYLPVAYLENRLYSIAEIQNFQKKISQFKKIKSVEIL